MSVDAFDIERFDAQRRGRPLARFADLFDIERERFFLWSPVCLGAGIAAYFALGAEPAWSVAAGLLAICVLVKLALPQHSLGAALLAALILAALGFVAAKARVEWVRAPVLEKNMRNAELTGRIERIEPKPARGERITIRVEKLGDLKDGALPTRVRVRTMKAHPDLRAGDRISMTATLAPPAKPALPGGFDFARMAWFEGLGGVGYTLSPLKVEPAADNASLRERFAIGVEELRRAIGARVKAALAGETGAIAAALITGERGGITEATNDAFKQSGLVHILSISGLHMVVMAGAVFFSVRFLLACVSSLALRYDIKKWAAAAGIAGALCYLAISGGAFATVRSAIMIVIMFAAILLGRPALALRNVAIAAFVILLLYPESLHDAGFQMSFAAVTALVAVYEAVRERFKHRDEPHPVLKLVMFLGGIVMTTLVAGAAVAPFGVYHFHQTQQYAALANLLAIPICNFVVMPAALASLVLMPIGLEGLALYPMGLGIDAMTWCARYVAALPGATGHVPAIPASAFLAFVMGGLWLTLWRGRQRLLGLAAILAAIALSPGMDRPDVFVARGGELVAVRGADGALSALPARQAKFELERWLESDGDARGAKEAASAKGFYCDGIGCTARVKGVTLSVARHPAAIAEDCTKAAILVLNVPRPKACATAGKVIDFFDVWRDGTHAIYVEPGAADSSPRLRIETVAAHRGDRPWAKVPERRLPLPRIARVDGVAPLPRFAARPEWLVPDLPRPEIEDEDEAFESEEGQ